MKMTPHILADRLGSLVIDRIIPATAIFFDTVEYCLPGTVTHPGRAYVVGQWPVKAEPGSVILDASGTGMTWPGCAVLICDKSPEDIYRLALDAMDAFRQLDHDLVDFIRNRRDLQQLIDRCALYIDNSLMVVDRTMRVIAASQTEALITADTNWDYIRQNKRIPDKVIERLAPLYRHQKKSDVLFDQRLIHGVENFKIQNIHVDLMDQNTYLGWLILIANRTPMTPGMVELIEQIAGYLVSLMKSMHEEAKPDLPLNDYFWQELLAGQLEDPATIQAMLRDRGWQRNDLYHIVYLDMNERTSDLELVAAVRSGLGEIFPFAVILPDDAGLVAIIRSRPPGKDPENFTGNLKNLLKKYDLPAGVSDRFTDFYNLHIHFIQAQVAVTYARQQADGRLVFYADRATDHLLECAAKSIDHRAFLHPAISRMLSEDHARHDKFARSLLVYLENDGQLSIAAARLFIHKNTLLYRIGTLTRKFDLRLDDPKERLRLLLSLRLADIEKKFL